MLEQMRRQGASIFIYLIFSLLIVIFVYGLAPSNRGNGEGCQSSGTSAVTVDGQEVSPSAWLVAYQGNNAGSRQKTYVALDFLIRRELLAQAAQQMGIRASGDMVDEEIKRGFFFLGGQRIDAHKMFFNEVGDDQFFDINQVKGWANQLGISLGAYREEQVRGLQAALKLLNDSLRAGSLKPAPAELSADLPLADPRPRDVLALGGQRLRDQPAPADPRDPLDRLVSYRTHIATLNFIERNIVATGPQGGSHL